MPSYVKVKMNFGGRQKDIDKVLSMVKSKKQIFDYEKIIPMPESLKIKYGSKTILAINVYLTHINPVVSYCGSKECKMIRNDFIKLVSGLNDELEGVIEYNACMSEKDLSVLTNIEELFELGKTAVNNFTEHGATTWYTWSCKNWYTKWNSISGERERNTITFLSAWNAPFPVLEKFTEMCVKSNVKFDGSFADESPGEYAGIIGCTGEGAFYTSFCEPMSHSSLEVFSEVWGNRKCIGTNDEGRKFLYECDNCPYIDCPGNEKSQI